MTALERRAGHPGPRDLPGRLPAVVGHLRICLVAGLGLSATFFMADLLRSMGDEGRLVGVVSTMAFVRRWPLYAAIGIGAFGMLTLPALWAFVGHQRLRRRLRNPLILPKRMSTPHLPAFTSVALHCVLVTTAVLLLTFIRCCGVMTNHELEALTLPIAYKSTDGPTPGPRVIVNVRPDGIIRVDGRTLTPFQLRKRLLRDAAEHRGLDGRSRLNVVIRQYRGTQYTFPALIAGKRYYVPG